MNAERVERMTRALYNGAWKSHKRFPRGAWDKAARRAEARERAERFEQELGAALDNPQDIVL